jgi:hypothetical protein
VRNLFTSAPFTFSEAGGLIVLEFSGKLDKLTRVRVGACGFKWDETRKAFVRKNNFDGINAANYLKAQLEAEYGRH